MSSSDSKLIRCVLSGGPCGGKSSALLWLKDKLKSKGFIVFTVPETSTILLTSGAVYPGMDPDRRQVLLDYETEYLKMQLALEDSLLSVARVQAPILGPPGTPVIVLFDRGTVDIKAYVSEDIWQEMMRRCGLDEEKLMSRYDVVCHLSTAAKGAEAFYTLANNEARSEGLEEARAVDTRTLMSWRDHPHHHVIGNIPGKDFQNKLERLLETILLHFRVQYSL